MITPTENSSRRYVVPTTPTCTRCKILQALVIHKSMTAQFEFIAANSPQGKDICAKYNVRTAGVIIDTQIGEIVTTDQVFFAVEEQDDSHSN